jgi:prophage maintenance system killer protein
LRFPTLDEVIACNELVREPDELSHTAEDDDLDLVAAALDRARQVPDVIEAAAVLVHGIAAAQGFFEGSKRTAVLNGAVVLEREH